MSDTKELQKEKFKRIKEESEFVVEKQEKALSLMKEMMEKNSQIEKLHEELINFYMKVLESPETESMEVPSLRQILKMICDQQKIANGVSSTLLNLSTSYIGGIKANKQQIQNLENQQSSIDNVFQQMFGKIISARNFEDDVHIAAPDETDEEDGSEIN